MNQRPVGPTGHALMVFGGAIGIVLAVAAVFVFAAKIDPALHDCASCRLAVAGAIAAFVIGATLVRLAWRTMRVPGSQ